MSSSAGCPGLRAALGSGRFATIVELVPWRGAAADAAGDRARRLAADLRTDDRIDALSITDGAGGHAVLSPEVLAGELRRGGQDVIVHVACRDRNRNELLSLGWRLAGAGIENLLVISGDYPVEGYLGVARPVFDLDSVGLLSLYAEMNAGRIGADVVGRPIARDDLRELPDLAPMRGRGGVAAPTDLHLGVAVNPFKRRERDLLPQYQKLELKARTGAAFAITQLGYDSRKLHELMQYVGQRDLAIALIANVFILGRGAARLFHAGEIPGVTVTDDLLAVVEHHAGSPDKGRAYFLELAAKQVAIARGLGFAGAYLGGSQRAEDYQRILEVADSFAADDWPALAREVSHAAPDTYWLFDRDETTGLNAPTLRSRPLARRGLRSGSPAAYRLNRVAHGLVFSPQARGFGPAAAVYGRLERAHLGHAAHVLEQAIKMPMFDCRDCGDCSLPEIAYLCVESQCAKNERNGPCGGSRDGECELPGKPCIWARAYERLRCYGEEATMLDRPVAIPDNALRRTSAWANTFLGRDHMTRPLITTSQEGRDVSH